MIEQRTDDKYPFNMQVLGRAIGGERLLVRLDNPVAPRGRASTSPRGIEAHGFQPPLGRRP
jgi:hypothetical protein